jgi:hypothetical protein
VCPYSRPAATLVAALLQLCCSDELCPCSRLPAARFGENIDGIKGEERSADKKPPLL